MEKSTLNNLGLIIWLGSAVLVFAGIYSKSPGVALHGLSGFGLCYFPIALDAHLQNGGKLAGFFVTLRGIAATASVVSTVWFLSLMARMAAPGTY